MAVPAAENGYTTTAPQFKPESLPLKQKPQSQLQPQSHSQSKTEVLQSLANTYIYPPATTALKILHRYYNTNPLLTTFVVAQLLTSTLPLLLFTIGVLTAGVVAAGLFACLGLLVLGPVLAVTGVLGGLFWGWGWGVFLAGRWVWGVYVEKYADNEGIRIKREDKGTGMGKC